MIDPSTATEVVILALVLSAVVIAVAGSRIARLADSLADATGWGEALFGAVFLGASTSLPGLMTSITAASQGHPDLAFSNAIGGIAAQTAFLAVADLFHRKANLEHAAASVPNIMLGVLLVILLMLVSVFMTSPRVAIGFVHPGSLVLPIVYVLGTRMIGGARKKSTWIAHQTPETVVDRPRTPAKIDGKWMRRAWFRFGGLAIILAAAGYVVAQAGVEISRRSGLSETVVGGLFTAVTTSLPELVTAVAAVRAGALTLAVGDIVGGNTFDVLFLAGSDAAYGGGSIYHDVQGRQEFVIALAGLMTAVLILGLLRREKRGIANIGFESFLILLIYLGGFTVLSIFS